MEEDGPSTFLPNADIDEAATTRIRAPSDERPYDSDEDTSFCFASRFTPGDDDDPSDLGAGQLKDAFRNMHALIDRHLNNNTSMTDLVGAVCDFYNSQIRAMHDYGEWTKKSIYRYIMHYSASSEDRQAAESIKVGNLVTVAVRCSLTSHMHIEPV